MFLRRHPDGTTQRLPLENQYAGAVATPCWIMGGGPGLSRSTAAHIAATPVPRFGINLAGSGLLRPHFWTSYDPTSRFHRSIYLDPAVTKFVHAARAMDLVPETTYKVCECPALYFIDREQKRGYHDFPGTGHSPITDWQDSLIQAIEIAYRLGFRDLYLAGCDMWIAPSRRLLAAAAKRGVMYQPRELLGDFVRRCEQKGLTQTECEELSTAAQYHFDESKSFAAAVQTDFHYFRVAQSLRLSRRSLALAGLRLWSVTAHSRLNDDFPYLTARSAARKLRRLIGDPALEATRGRYSREQDRRPRELGPMKDFRPHFWTASGTPAPPDANRSKIAALPKEKHIEPAPDPLRQLRQAFDDLPGIPVDLQEQG